MKGIIFDITLTMSMLCMHLIVVAQNKPTIAGQIFQLDNNPAAYATVMLLKTKDSAIIKGAIADKEGNYLFEQVMPDKYLVAAIAPGMHKSYSIIFHADSGVIKVPAVYLETTLRKLKSIDVIARKPFIEQKADKLIVNVENSITAAGGTAMDVLEKSPTVNVDKDGNISLKGKGGVIIMIDGKQTNMTSQDVAIMLRSMPASNLDQIELIANPSAKYDAAGNAGIINIKLKKNTGYGTNGHITIGGAYSVWPRWNSGLNLNRRNAKFNIFGGYNYSNSHQLQELGLYRSLTINNQDRVYDQVNTSKLSSDYHAGKIGIDYFISKGHILGVMADLTANERHNPGNSTTLIGNGKEAETNLFTKTNAASTWKRGAYNLNYRGTLDSTGKELNIDLDYAKNTNRQYAQIFATSRQAIDNNLLGSDTSRNNQPAEIDIKTVKADYTHPLKHQAKLEAGMKISFVKTDNNARFDSLKKEMWVLDENRSNHFIYKENISAAYINFVKQIKKVALQAGLRGEQTNISSLSESVKASNNHLIVHSTAYFDWFPSMALTFSLNKDNTLGLSYSRRIQRPSYDNLNPFEYNLDRYTKAVGNPDLKPQYSNNFEVTHTYKAFVTSSIGYSHTKNMMTRILEAAVDNSTGDTSILKYMYKNVAEADNFNFNVSVPLPVTKWWSSFTTASFSYGMYETNVDKNLVKLSTAGFFGRAQQTFTLNKHLSAEAVFFYVSPQVTSEGLFKMKSMYGLDLGLEQSILKGKGRIKLSVTDVFKTNYFRGSFENGGRNTSVVGKWDAQQYRLAFTWRFGNANVKAARNRQTGLEAEQNRVKQ